MKTPTASSAFTTTSTPVPLLDIGRENRALEAEIQAAISQVCRSGAFVLGPECQKLEQQIAQLCQARFGIGCASGSDALLLALMALDVGPGDEVLVPSFTFFATASAVWRLGAKPVFVDIDPVTYNINPQLLEAAVTAATKAIIPVHLFGQAADMPAIQQFAREHSLAIVEDAAQAIGSAYQQRPVGSWSEVGCLSFYPTKNLGGFGDGGMMVTSDPALSERLQLLRGHGMKPRYYHQEVGINSRLDALQAAVLNVKLTQLASWTALRQQHAQRYGRWLNQAGVGKHLVLPTADPHVTHVWNQYTIRVLHGQRDMLRAHLQQLGIGTEIYYPVPLHQQACFQSLGYRPGSLPETERAAQEVLSLPVFPQLTEQEQETVVDQICAFYRRRAAPIPVVASPHLTTRDVTTS